MGGAVTFISIIVALAVIALVGIFVLGWLFNHTRLGYKNVSIVEREQWISRALSVALGTTDSDKSTLEIATFMNSYFKAHRVSIRLSPAEVAIFKAEREIPSALNAMRDALGM